MSRSSGELGAKQWPALVAALTGAAIWLLTHPYIGTDGDGSLYTMMALNRTTGGAFNSDLFLRYGSQDAYSVFSPIYGWAIGWIGTARANIVLLLCAHGVWLCGAWLLSHRLARGVAGHAAFLLICALPLTYGGLSFLTAGDTYLTARPFAEGLTLVALGALLSRAWLGAALAFALAAVFHPIMALTGLGAGYVLLVARRPLLIALFPLGVVVLIGLALARVAPFDRALMVMDAPWLAAIRLRTPFIFMGEWRPADWARAACDLAPCVAAALWTGGPRRALFAAAALASAGSLALSFAAGDLGHDALILQLQLSRAGWLIAVVQLPALVAIWLRLRGRATGRLIAALLAAPSLMLTPGFETLVWAPALAMSLAGLALAILARTRRPIFLTPRTEARWLVAAAVLPATSLTFQVVAMWKRAAFVSSLGLTLQGEADFLPVRLALLAAGLALLKVARRRPAVAWAPIAVAFIVGALTWDQRTPWDHYRLGGKPLPIAAALPAGANLLWGLDAADTWFLTGRPAYVSGTQAAGLLFSRVTAMEWSRRRDAVAAVLPIGSWMSEIQPPACARAGASPEAVDAICARSPGLYAIILDRPMAGAISFVTPARKESLCATGAGFGVTRVDRFYYVVCPKTR